MTSTDFSGGQVPAIYREVFDVCSVKGEPIHRDVLQQLLSSCNLDTGTLKKIWDLTGPSQGQITRTQLYKTLALIGWAQNGKTINESCFENLNGREYPTPNVANLDDIKKCRDCLILQANPAVLGLTYNEIKQLDTIGVELVPEKKGLILKYSEYAVSSRRFSSKVTRRYNDFVALYELLLARFPYRIVPRLPPKKIVSDSHFLESRRRGLQRWLTLICRHPVMCHDALLSFFLTDQGPDIQYRIRDIFKRAPDEFMTSDLAGNSKNYLPNDYLEFATNREQVKTLVQIVSRIKQLTDSEVDRTNAFSRDAEDLANQLKSLGNASADHLPGGHWKRMQSGFVSIAEDLKELPNKASQHAIAEQVAVCEKLALLLDVLSAHRDLCERLERGLAHDHQAALAKMLSLKKRKIQGVIRGADSESVEQLEAKMLTQENLITNMELRSDFSMYCVHMETQLVHTYLETLSSIMTSMISLQIRLHTEFGDIWKQINPNVEKYFTLENSASNGSK